MCISAITETGEASSSGGRTMQELLGIGWVLLGLVAWFLLCQAFNKALDWLFGKWDINGKDD